jgi:hypothetical protein
MEDCCVLGLLIRGSPAEPRLLLQLGRKSISGRLPLSRPNPQHDVLLFNMLTPIDFRLLYDFNELREIIPRIGGL